MPQFDVVIVGSGLAGMRAAVEITNRVPSARVAILSQGVSPAQSLRRGSRGHRRCPRKISETVILPGCTCSTR